jgi:peptidoglycan/xylan/chitin deacetylase (PgdA/CDA1 family)
MNHVFVLIFRHEPINPSQAPLQRSNPTVSERNRNYEGLPTLKSMKSFIAAGLALAAALYGATGMAAPAASPACDPSSLNVSRTISVGAGDGLFVGTKTYPQTLALADHEVVLTFDDGPAPGTTNRILDALAAECVRATFFLIGRNAKASPELVKREIALGHTVGHHSFSHPDQTLRNMPEAMAKADIDKGFAADDLAAYGAAGARPRVPFFRFPGFGDSPALNDWLKSRNIAVFGADFWASDWVMMTPRAELQLILSRLEQAKKGIILFHDSKASTAAIMPDFLRELKQRGYRIVHLVPGETQPELAKAPEGWSSETEATMQRMFSKMPASRTATPKTAAPAASMAAPTITN